jgi:enoyl-CoA hydratase/carnithine racemase
VIVEGDSVSGRQALAMDLVDEVAADQLLPAALDFARASLNQHPWPRAARPPPADAGFFESGSASLVQARPARRSSASPASKRSDHAISMA